MSLFLVFSIVVTSLIGCGGDESAKDSDAVRDTIDGYYTTFNAEDFDKCLTYFTDYGDKDDALSFLSYMRSISGPLEVRKIRDINIFPPAVPGSGYTATSTVTFTITGEESTDQIQLKKVNEMWKIIWEQ